MTSRERIRKTLKHKEPDRIPLDIGGTECSSLSGVAYPNLRAYLGLAPGKVRIFQTTQQVAFVDEDIVQLFEIDAVPLALEPRRWRKSEFSDGSPCEIPEQWAPEKEESGDLIVRSKAGAIVARMPKGGFYFDLVQTPLANVTEPKELAQFADAIDRFDYPFYADEPLDDFEARARRLHETTDLAVIADLRFHILQAGQTLRGYENFMMDLIAEKALVHALFDRLTSSYMKRCDDLLGRVGKYIDGVLLTEDLGTQNGPMMSMDCYTEMLLPYQKKLFAHIHSKTDAAVILHSCGSVHEFIPYLIEAGVDALNPVQVSAAGMDTKRLKREFGKDITFWGGGCSTQGILNRATPRQVAEEVRRRVADLAPGGGFVFSQVHNIQPDVPSENIVAMVEAFKKVRDYA